MASWSVAGTTVGACVVMFVLWSCGTSAAGSSGEINGTSSGTGGCVNPGSKCAEHDDCCIECFCNGAPYQVDYTSCDTTAGKCRSCTDHCGDAGVNYSKVCSKCSK